MFRQQDVFSPALRGSRNLLLSQIRVFELLATNLTPAVARCHHLLTAVG